MTAIQSSKAKFAVLDAKELKNRRKLTRVFEATDPVRVKEFNKVKDIEEFVNQEIEEEGIKSIEKQFDAKMVCLKDNHEYKYLRDPAVSFMKESKLSDNKDLVSRLQQRSTKY